MIRTALTMSLSAIALVGHSADVTVFMYSEYIHPDIAKEFTAATGMSCDIQVYEAQEDMLAKLKTGGSGQYDVIVATDVMIPQLVGLDLVQPLDKAKLKHLGNLDPSLMNQSYDKDNRHSVPYFWGTVGMLYRVDAVRTPATWKWFFDPAQQPGPFVIMDEARTTLACANLAIGKDFNDRTASALPLVIKALAAAKKSPKSLGFDGGVGGKNKVVSGEAAVAMVYNGDAVTAIRERAEARTKGATEPALAFAIPVEGSNIWVDCMLVTKGSKNVDGAHRFIDYLSDAAVAAKNANHMHYATPVAAAKPMIEKDDLADTAIYPDAETMKRLHYIADPGKDQTLLDAAWTKVKGD